MARLQVDVTARDMTSQGLQDVEASAGESAERIGEHMGNVISGAILAAVGLAIDDAVDTTIERTQRLRDLERLTGTPAEGSQAEALRDILLARGTDIGTDRANFIASSLDITGLDAAIPPNLTPSGTTPGGAAQIGGQISDFAVAAGLGNADLQQFFRVADAFAVPDAEFGNFAEYLNATATASSNRVEVPEILRSLGAYGPVLSQAGFSLGEQISFIGDAAVSAAPLRRIGPGINQYLRRGGSRAGLEDIFEQIESAQSDARALEIATEAFGAEGAVRLTQGVRAGSLDISPEGLAFTGEGQLDVASLAQPSAGEFISQQRTQYGAGGGGFYGAFVRVGEDIPVIGTGFDYALTSRYGNQTFGDPQRVGNIDIGQDRVYDDAGVTTSSSPPDIVLRQALAEQQSLPLYDPRITQLLETIAANTRSSRDPSAAAASAETEAAVNGYDIAQSSRFAGGR